jgi:GTP-binding protein
VGKSTLFNRLIGKKLALVDQTPGLTRDRKECVFHDSIFEMPIRLVDTAGYEG